MSASVSHMQDWRAWREMELDAPPVEKKEKGLTFETAGPGACIPTGLLPSLSPLLLLGHKLRLCVSPEQERIVATGIVPCQTAVSSQRTRTIPSLERTGTSLP